MGKNSIKYNNNTRNIIISIIKTQFKGLEMDQLESCPKINTVNRFNKALLSQALC
jgi:hypothetical protein